MRGAFTRRRFAVGAAAGVVAGAGAAAWLTTRGGEETPDRPATLPPPARRPDAQHAWNDALRHDEHRNPLLPRHHRILLLELAATPDADAALRLEVALRTLEHAHGPRELLTLLAWGPAYFEAIGQPSPVPEPAAIDADEVPELDRCAAVLVLASDNGALLRNVERRLFGGRGDAALDLRPILHVRERRTGFAGAGMPALAQRRAGGLGLDRPLPDDAPMFMGFLSGRRRNQATEQDVTIADGPFAGGTTLHLSVLTLELDSWYRLSERDRVARMFAPQQTPADVARFTDDAPAPADDLERTAARYGRVGHTQALAAVRRDGRPLILRRDVNTLDGGGPGVHFLSLQRSIDDFVTTRRAMTAARSRSAPQLTSQLNNGINEWMRVTNRGNFIVPPRRLRAFPLLEADRA